MSPRRGRWLVIAGPDGAGKSALTDALADACDRPPLRGHHRIGFLPRRTASMGPVTEPHAAKPYPAWLSYLKVALLALDGVAGYLAFVRPALRSGRWVLLERGWWDVGVDPRRYRLAARPGVILRLARVQPTPDLLVVLEAPVEVILGRKAELDADEIRRQVALWRRIAASTHSVVLDSRRPIPELVEATHGALEGLDSGIGHGMDRAGQPTRYVGLPPGRRPRFLVPAGPRRLAVAGLQVFHPVTRRGRLLWQLARMAASVGAFRLLPTRALPDDMAAVEALAPGSTWALQNSRRGSRRSGLAIDPSGAITCIVKLALTPTVAARLEHEARSIEKLGPLLAPPVVAGRVRSAQPGILCFDAVAWQARSQAWRLPPEVAESLGAFYRRAGGDASRGPAHGDFAPWNLLKLRDGRWLLIAWEDATEAAPPFHDAFHWLVQAHALLGRPRTEELRAGLGGSGWVGLALARYAAAAGLASVDLRSAFRDHLIATAAGLRESPDAQQGEVAVRDRLLAALDIPQPDDRPDP